MQSKSSMRTAFSSHVLVAAQLGLLAAMVIPDARLHFSPVGVALLTLGTAFGLWALATMGRHLRILPEPAAKTPLIRSGPYRWVCHPIYSAVALAALGWVWCDFSCPRLACWLALLPALGIKALREERLLAAKFSDYAAYRATTRRFIPWVW